MLDPLGRTRELEKEYDWTGAARLYKNLLDNISQKDPGKVAETNESLGHALYRAAMQAEDADEFRERIRQASSAYQTAEEFYGRLGDRRTPRRLRCQAMVNFLGFWLSTEAPEKKKSVDEAWKLAKNTLEILNDRGDRQEYARTYSQLSSSALFAAMFGTDFRARQNTFRELMRHGERTVEFLSETGDRHELARALVKAAGHMGIGQSFLDFDEVDEFIRKASGYWQRASEISEEIALIELAGFEGGYLCLIIPWDTSTLNRNLGKALEYGRKTGDNLIIGGALEWLAFAAFWTFSTEGRDERIEYSKKALQYAEEARAQYSKISFTSPGRGVLWVGMPYAEYYWDLAKDETDLQRKRELLEKARGTSADLLRHAKDSGYPRLAGYAYHVVSKILAALAKTETSLEQKKKLLEEALEYRRESVRSSEQLYGSEQPFGYWDRGVDQGYLADIISEIARENKDSQSQEKLLIEASSARESGLKLCIKLVEFWEKTSAAPDNRVLLGRWQYELGDLLIRLYDITNDRRYLERAAESFLAAAESFRSPDLPSRMAECHWKTAQAYDRLGENQKSGESFLFASTNYKLAAEKLAQLRDFYQEYAYYMEAWSEIQKARYHHARQEYGPAKEFYEKAAIIHGSTKQWSFLAPTYSAWAQVENAEDLSRKEQIQEASLTFQDAANLFRKGKLSIQAELAKIDKPDQKQMATRLAQAADLRVEYCRARTVLEEARLLDKEGDHLSSSEKYGLAAKTLQKIAESVESEETRQEFKPIIALARAWQAMAQAEAEASPELYLRASKLFEEAKQLTTNEKAKMLALGHSRFCRALEAGTRFADTRDPTLHTTTLQHLESAANFYAKAGSTNASEYAKASKLLFDAYVYMDEANRERDIEKKAKLSAMAEKVLHASADSYEKAEYPGKRREVMALLEKVKDERELVVSLSNVLLASSIVSTTTSFSTPTPTHEKAVGLERFEQADVQARLIARKKNLKMGEDLDLEIEVVNAGRGPAQLVKMEELIPEGFELAANPGSYRVEDNYLNMKGKRLDPLKTEEVKLVLRPMVQGDFTLKPRILFLDENGKYRTHEPEPVDITVRELGIAGWLKGR